MDLTTFNQAAQVNQESLQALLQHIQELEELQERQAAQIDHHTQYIRALELRIQELEGYPVQREKLNNTYDEDQRPTAPFPVLLNISHRTATAPLTVSPNLFPEMPTVTFSVSPSEQSGETNLRERPRRVTSIGWFLIVYGFISFCVFFYAMLLSPLSQNWLHNTPPQAWGLLISQLFLCILGIGLLKLRRWVLLPLTLDILFNIGMDGWIIFQKVKLLSSPAAWMTSRFVVTSVIEGFISSILFFIILFALLLSRKVRPVLR